MSVQCLHEMANSTKHHECRCIENHHSCSATSQDSFICYLMPGISVLLLLPSSWPYLQNQLSTLT